MPATNRRFFDRFPARATPPAVPLATRAELIAAYDQACARAARDENPADFAEARALGAALDRN